MGWLKAGNHVAEAVNQELGEVPFDVAVFSPARILLVKHLLQDWSKLVVSVKALEALLAFEPGVERQFVRAVYITLLELREVSAIVKLAELSNFLVCAWSLVAKLVARHIQNLEAFVLELLVDSFQLLILRCESASCSCIYYQKNLSCVL